ncbi:MAG: IS21 family transposase [Thermodesulfobacteriota bacterium]|nr:IS21 family transposase [Thermodesulfobacteriota bacterium]
MINKRTVFEMYRLKDFGFSRREIARQLNIDRATVAKYLDNPDPAPGKRAKRTSKLEPYRDEIADMLKQFPAIKAPVIMQRLKEKGFDGEITIVRNLLRQLRGQINYREPFIRFESDPGVQVQVDWGHFNSLSYKGGNRKLYALAVIESHSRMLYVTFTHTQKQEQLHMGLLDAFTYFGGCPKEIVVDNMLTAVTERVGTLIRFNEAFLDFLRVLHITPRACNIRAPHEKGKIENSIKYIRQNFWPLRSFADLDDVGNQIQAWLDTVANVRKHQTTGERPVDRLQQETLQPLPEVLPDCRETASPLVHKDFAVRFDANTYTVPPWTIGKKVTLKADNQTVLIYYKDKAVAVHRRCWGKKQRIELPAHKEQVKKVRKKLYHDRQIMLFLSVGQIAADYLDKLADARQPIRKTVTRLLSLQDEYGDTSLIYALRKGLSLKLYGADYIQNILYQEMTPVTNHRPVKLKKQDLNNIRLTTPSLAEYDAIALKRRKK